MKNETVRFSDKFNKRIHTVFKYCMAESKLLTGNQMVNRQSVLPPCTKETHYTYSKE